jgi:serine/threonine protein phosphatase PrpC
MGGRMDYTTTLDIGKRKRRQGGINEDSVAVNLLEEGHRDTDRRTGVFVVADGAGGAQAGDIASYVTTVEVTRELTDRLWTERRLGEVLDLADSTERGGGGGPELTEDVVGDPLADRSAEAIEDLIADAIGTAHTRVLEVVNELELQQAYSTVVAAVTVGDRLHYGWVGDSRAYVVNTAPNRADDQRLSLLTQDHSEVERLVTQGEIDDVEAHVHRRGNRVTRALGGTRGEDPATSAVEVDTATVPLYGDDVVLLTSDGLIDAYTGAPQLHQEYERSEDTDEVAERILEKSVTDDEIRDVIVAADSLDAAADRFVDLSNERGGKDNVSVVLFRDEGLADAIDGGLPIREYDPDREAVLDREAVHRHSDDESGGSNGADPAE